MIFVLKYTRNERFTPTASGRGRPAAPILTSFSRPGRWVVPGAKPWRNAPGRNCRVAPGAKARDFAPAPALTNAEVTGAYESYNEDGTIDSRFVLTEDGNIRWIYENDYLEYSFVIRINRIYDDVNEVNAQSRYTYVYDPATRNILSFNRVYYRKK